MIILAIIIIISIILLYFIHINIPFKLQTINFFSGGLGSGKSNEATKLAINLRNRSKIKYYLIGKHPTLFFAVLFSCIMIFVLQIPELMWLKLTIFMFLVLLLIIVYKKRNIIKDKCKIRTIYSNYPILIGYKRIKVGNKKIKTKIWSEPFTKEHFLGKIKCEENCIIVIDEVDRMFPNQPRKSDVEIDVASQQIRHWFNPTIIMSSQSIGSIDIALRRRINVVYNLSSHKGFFGIFYKVDVNRIIYMEDVVVNINDINDLKPVRHFGFYGKRRYDSRYMREFYNPEYNTEELILSWQKFTISKDDKDVYMNNMKGIKK
jgi:hypothetical protein